MWQCLRKNSNITIWTISCQVGTATLYFLKAISRIGFLTNSNLQQETSIYSILGMGTIMETGQSKPYKNQMEIFSPFNCLPKFGKRVDAVQKYTCTFLWTLATLLVGVSDLLKQIITHLSAFSPLVLNFNYQPIWKEAVCWTDVS